MSTRFLGLAAIGLAILYNVAFARLAAIFDYPEILRRPAAEVLDAFAAGGPALVLAWLVFALSALAFVPLSMALALHRRPTDNRAIAAAMLGALAGTLQAIGLMRWVFAVPALAATDGLGREVAFLILNSWGGVAVGEHLGQWLTALFLGTMALIAWSEGARVRAAVAASAALLIVAGAQEGVLLALGRDPGILPGVAVAGYLGLSLWLIVEGVLRLRPFAAPAGRAGLAS